MRDKTVKATKLVDKATNVFYDAKVKVIKANDILINEIQKQVDEIDFLSEKIKDMQAEISRKQFSNQEKYETVESNNELIEKLNQFISE